MVTTKQLFISLIFNEGNTLLLIYYIYDLFVYPTELTHITRLSYYSNSIYALLCLIYDVYDYFYGEIEAIRIKSSNNEVKEQENSMFFNMKQLNDFNRNKFGIIANTFSYFITIGFWSLYFF